MNPHALIKDTLMAKLFEEIVFVRAYVNRYELCEGEWKFWCSTKGTVAAGREWPSPNPLHWGGFTIIIQYCCYYYRFRDCVSCMRQLTTSHLRKLHRRKSCGWSLRRFAPDAIRVDPTSGMIFACACMIMQYAVISGFVCVGWMVALSCVLY